MQTVAVVLEAPERLNISRLALDDPGEDDLVVDIEWSGISTGTERLLYTGTMPAFPGMGYPLVPGYESVGRVAAAGAKATIQPGERVFVPGARCYGEVRGLFGGAASRIVVPQSRVVPLGAAVGEESVLLALAATAYHAIAGSPVLPELIVGHGVLGRLIARIVLAKGGEPVVWERNSVRAGGKRGYTVLDPGDDDRFNYRAICDASGDPDLLNGLIARLAPRGEVVLAGFYTEPLSFVFAPAFMREARLRVAAEWQPDDLAAVQAMVESGALSLRGLITHRESAEKASDAYRTAFNDPYCLKMILNWRNCA
jgi:3-hydroxyethyl bacteriochlorophyllide a dehydrogenase